jgi:hypothetical protein
MSKHKNRLLRGLEEAMTNREVVKIVRQPKSKLQNVEGFVVGLSEKFVLFNDMNPDYFAINGYACLRIQDIRTGETIGGPEQFVGRAVLLRGIEPTVQADIDLTEITSLLLTAGDRFPLVVIHLEKGRPDVCYIGRVLKVGRRRVTLKTIAPDASWDEEVEKFRLSQITMVQFDDAYSRMLWEVNQAFDRSPLQISPNVGKA